MALNIKGASEELKSTVHVDFVDVPVYEDRLGFYKTYEIMEQGSLIVHWVLLGLSHLASFACH